MMEYLNNVCVGGVEKGQLSQMHLVAKEPNDLKGSNVVVSDQVPLRTKVASRKMKGTT